MLTRLLVCSAVHAHLDVSSWQVPQATLHVRQADWLLWDAGAQSGGQLASATCNAAT